MSTLSQVAMAIFNLEEDIVESIGFDQFLLFVMLCSHLFNEIDYSRKLMESLLGPPAELPSNIAEFLAKSLSSEAYEVSVEVVNQLWDGLSEHIWSLGPQEASKDLIPLFLRHGTPLGVGKSILLIQR
jgi:hypothetical protein